MDYRHTHVYTYFCVNYSWKYTEKKKDLVLGEITG